MSAYLVHRTLLAALTLLGVSVLIFGLMQLAPGGPEVMLIGEDMPPQMAERIRIRLGLHEPVHVRYVRWLSACLEGDFGYSFKTGHPVLPLLIQTLQRTLILSISALLMAVVVSIPVGVMSAVRQYTGFDQLITFVTFIGISMPSFWLGLMAMLLFGFRLGWFPISGVGTVGMSTGTLEYYLDRARHLVLPALVLGVGQMASFVRFCRSSMLEVLSMDYVRTARAKGLSETIVIYKHALRNGLISIVTIVGVSLRLVVGGSVVVESVFAYSGIGRLAARAVFERDHPIIMGVGVLIAVVVLAGNLLTDVAYAVIDPRIRFD